MKNELKSLFQSSFNLEKYTRTVLSGLLHAQRINTRPELLEETSDDDTVYGLGIMEDADRQRIGLFYTDVRHGDVTRKRVGLRRVVEPYIKANVDAALAVFDDGRHWRLSFVTDLQGQATAPKRFSYVMGDPQGQYRTPVDRLAALGGASRTQTPALAAIREAFSVETLSDEFFDQYREHYADIVEYITGKRMVKVSGKWEERVIHVPNAFIYGQLSSFSDPDKIMRDYVKKMMGRIVFLHFLQKKGWLCGDANFMQNTFLNSRARDNYLESLLEPLFFGMLNTEPEHRDKVFNDYGWNLDFLAQWNANSQTSEYSRSKGIPYLNGGLFEEDEVDKIRVVLPAFMFQRLYDFLASYNFTVDENDPDDAEIGVDPEMLGKIFESLLEDNKAKGAFYTPKEIVRYMCRESLIAYLNTKMSACRDAKFCVSTDNAIRSFVEHHEFPSELEPYRDVIDGALREVRICDPAIGSGAFPMGLLNELWRCREAISTSSSTHSRLALKKEIIENNIYGVDIEKGAIDIARLRFWLSIVVDSDKPEPLPNFDYKFMQGNSLIESFGGVDLSQMMNDDLRSGRSGKGRNKVGENQLGLEFASNDTKRNLQVLLKEYFSITDHVKKAEMRQGINDSVKSYIRQSGIASSAEIRLAALDPSANQEFFLWHTWFKDIFDRGGFDIVIGNPPYISAVEMARTESEKNLYKVLYPQATGAYDLYVLFLLRGIQLSKSVFFWIIPNKFLIADYAKKTYQFLLNNGLSLSVDVSTFKVFKNANVYPIIIGGTKDTISKFSKYSLDKYSDLLSGKFCQIQDIEAQSTISDSGMSVCSGSTGFEAQTIKEYVIDGYQNGAIPFTVSGNIDRYCFNNKNVRYMKDKYHQAYILPGFEISDNKILMWKRPKIIIAGMTKVIEATYVEHPLAIGVGAYAIDDFGEHNPYYVLGLLNSKYTSYFLRMKFKDKHLAGGYLAINKSTIEQLPFIEADSKTEKLIVELVKRIIISKQSNPNTNTTDLEREIDRLVYELYGLTEEEVKVVEGK